MPKLDLRPGAKVRYQPTHTDVWRQGKLVRSSPNQEEWLVEHPLGRSWVHVLQLHPADGTTEGSLR